MGNHGGNTMIYQSQQINEPSHHGEYESDDSVRDDTEDGDGNDGYVTDQGGSLSDHHMVVIMMVYLFNVPIVRRKRTIEVVRILETWRRKDTSCRGAKS